MLHPYFFSFPPIIYLIDLCTIFSVTVVDLLCILFTRVERVAHLAVEKLLLTSN